MTTIEEAEALGYARCQADVVAWLRASAERLRKGRHETRAEEAEDGAYAIETGEHVGSAEPERIPKTATAAAIQASLRALPSDEDRVTALEEILDGICIHCGSVGDPGSMPCQCMNDE